MRTQQTCSMQQTPMLKRQNNENPSKAKNESEGIVMYNLENSCFFSVLVSLKKNKDNVHILISLGFKISLLHTLL